MTSTDATHAFSPAREPSSQPPVSATMLGRGLAARRIFMGVTFFANGLAKLTGQRNYDHDRLLLRAGVPDALVYRIGEPCRQTRLCLDLYRKGAGGHVGLPVTIIRNLGTA